MYHWYVSVANTNKTQIQNQSTDTKQVMGISDTVSAWLVLANTSQRCFGTSTVSSCTVFVEPGGTRGRCAAMCAMRFVFNRLAKCVTSSWKSRGANMCMNWILIEICRGRWICAGNHDAQMAFLISFLIFLHVSIHEGIHAIAGMLSNWWWRNSIIVILVFVFSFLVFVFSNIFVHSTSGLPDYAAL